MENGNKGTLTPEQMAQVSAFKTGGEVPAQKPAQKPVQKSVQQPAKSKVIQRPRQPSRKAIQGKQQLEEQVESPVVQENFVETVKHNDFKIAPIDSNGSETYYVYESSDGGFFEVDLVTFREKGTETRYLSLEVAGLNMTGEEPVPQQAMISLESREQFEELKAFFTQLSWED